MNLSRVKEAYLIGIKGTGMAAIAEFLAKRKIKVSGSDTKEKFFTEEILRRNKIPYFEGFSENHVKKDTDLFVYSTAYNSQNNIEIAQAEKMKKKLISYPELLGLLFKEKTGIAVSGTHGKTTTSAMLAHVLKEAGEDPSAIVGSQVIDWKGSMLFGKGEFFVAEADEYQDKLRFYDPWSAILTSADWDHPDFFPTAEEYREVFKKFVSKIPKTGYLIVWGDSVDTLDVAESCRAKILKYGFNADNEYRIANYTAYSSDEKRIAQSFEVFFDNESLGKFDLKLLGKHNALNACSVIAMCHKIGVRVDEIREGLRNFNGTSRRFEILGTYEGAVVIDDYGHHPDEIRATLKGARERYPDKKIWAVFHPHTFSRTQALLHEFSQSFDDADKVTVLDIYASAREDGGKVSSEELVGLMNMYATGKAEYIPSVEEAAEHLSSRIGYGDVLILIGAGNVWEIGKKLLKK